MSNSQVGVQNILDRALATLEDGTDIAISSETVISLCRMILDFQATAGRAIVDPEDIPLAAIEAFHEVNPLAPTEPYDWSDKMLLSVRQALAAAMNAMPDAAGESA